MNLKMELFGNNFLGIGKAIANALTKQNCRVYALDKNEELLKKFKQVTFFDIFHRKF